MNVNIYPLLRGILSYVLPDNMLKRPGSGGTFSAEYCYSVWLRHLVKLNELGLIKNISDIKTIAEIGPGDSLGIGIAAVFSGIKEYYGFDVIRHANKERNIKIANEIYQLFLQKNGIPSGPKYVNTNPGLNDYRFPEEILGENMNELFLRDRKTEIIKALNDENSQIIINYTVPWDSSENLYPEKIDLIYSQAVMEHVEDIASAYTAMYKWLKPGGILSHQIDFKTHEMTKEWNGHWYIAPYLWKFLLHGRKYSINRLPVSAHVNAIEKAGFTIKNVQPVHSNNSFGSKPVKVNNCNFTKDDYQISSALIQAVK
jgi:hypothetical protein